MPINKIPPNGLADTARQFGNLTDVDTANRANGKIIRWNSTTSKHDYIDPPTGGGGLPEWSFNPKNYGAVGNGTTNDSAAFVAMYAAVIARVVNNQNAGVIGDTNRRGRVIIDIPPGNYRISSPEALIPSTYTTRTLGLTIRGEAAGVTQITYDNATAGKYLVYNNDAWLFLRMENIEFTSTNVNNNFMLSYSTGGAQNYRFSDCMWNGLWNRIFDLQGNNNNSEFAWYTCNFNGTVKTVLFTDENGSDQFLNYNFYACNYEVSEGSFIDMQTGGNIALYGGSFIHYGENAGTFFKLYGESHAYGVQRFLCVGVRFEHRNTNSILIDTEWPFGSIQFINCDNSGSIHFVPSYVNAIFYADNASGAAVKFDGCVLMGQHQYWYGNDAWKHPNIATYDNCELMQESTAETFVNYRTSGGNDGAKPVVRFRACRFVGGTELDGLVDKSVGALASNRGELSLRYVSIKTAQGRLPSANGTETFILPPGAIIVGAYLYWRNGASTSGSTTWNFTLRTSETTPTVIVTAASTGTTLLRDGFNVENERFFVCDTLQKRTLVLAANTGVDQNTPDAHCIVKFLC